MMTYVDVEKHIFEKQNCMTKADANVNHSLHRISYKLNSITKQNQAHPCCTSLFFSLTTFSVHEMEQIMCSQQDICSVQSCSHFIKRHHKVLVFYACISSGTAFVEVFVKVSIDQHARRNCWSCERSNRSFWWK